MPEDKSNKTEQPTPRRLQQAREKGQVAKSQEINTCIVLLVAVFTLFFSGAYLYQNMTGIMRHVLGNIGQITLENGNLMAFVSGNIMHVFAMLAPVIIAIPVAGILANMLQIGSPVFAVTSIQPKLSKINPISGFGRMFSSKSLMELFKSVVKILLISTTAYLTIRGDLKDIIPIGDASPANIGHFALALAFEIFLKTCWLLLILAAIDFAFQKYTHHRDMMMSKEEVKEEMKQTEGDPIVKSRIRSAQRDMARKRMMAKVPEADVVVTNPVHLAVALIYDPDMASAPIVVAKGQALLAERIKQIAREHNVPIMEDKPLARSLYKMVDIGEEIPFLFYQAVAEILSYVYRMKGKTVNG
jgi:flagellar biosynthetic protein FlhB